MRFKRKVCLTCGDSGFPETLVYCNKCRSYAVHRYCMSTIILRGDVVWLCDDCEHRNPKSFALRQTVRERLRDQGPKQNGLEDRITAENTKFSGLAESSFQEAADFEETKNREAPTVEVPTLERDFSKDNKEQQVEVKTGPDRLLSNEANTSSTSESIPPGFEKYIEAQPVEVPIWRGSIRISREDSVVPCCQLAAHLSSRACHMVCDAAKSLPRFLAPDLMPRSDLWPNGFRRWGPSDNSIGLYFFPSGERSAKIFDRLVNEMTSNDLAMKTVTEAAELLIFTSNVLPIAYRRFQAKFYLWGVFRRKRPTHVTVDVEPKVVVNIGAGSPELMDHFAIHHIRHFYELKISRQGKKRRPAIPPLATSLSSSGAVKLANLEDLFHRKLDL